MKRTKIVILLFLIVSLGALSCSKTPDPLPVEPVRKEVVLNVDVIAPQAIKEQWTESIGLAQKAIALAQNRVDNPVRLNLRYHNEETEDLDALGYALTLRERVPTPAMPWWARTIPTTRSTFFATRARTVCRF